MSATGNGPTTSSRSPGPPLPPGCSAPSPEGIPTPRQLPQQKPHRVITPDPFLATATGTGHSGSATARCPTGGSHRARTIFAVTLRQPGGTRRPIHDYRQPGAPAAHPQEIPDKPAPVRCRRPALVLHRSPRRAAPPRKRSVGTDAGKRDGSIILVTLLYKKADRILHSRRDTDSIRVFDGCHVIRNGAAVDKAILHRSIVTQRIKLWVLRWATPTLYDHTCTRVARMGY